MQIVECPVPGCHHTGDVLTNHHCVSVHSMTRSEVLATFGHPISHSLVISAKVRRWAERESRVPYLSMTEAKRHA